MSIKRNVPKAAASPTQTDIPSLVSSVAVSMATASAPPMDTDISLNVALSSMDAASPADILSSMDATDVTLKSRPIAAASLPPMDILSNVASSPMDATSPMDLLSSMDAADTTSKSKPKRPCVYCGKFQTKLRRHLVLIHNGEVAVSNAIKQVSKRDKDNAFNSIKKSGILEENKKVIKSGMEAFLCELNQARKYFSLLERAIKKTTLSEEEQELKAGLKLYLGYVIKRLAKVLKAQYLIDDKDIMPQTVDNFLKVFEIQWPYVFGDAESKVKINRQEKLRKPAHLVPKKELVKLQEHTQLVLEEYTKKMMEYNF